MFNFLKKRKRKKNTILLLVSIVKSKFNDWTFQDNLIKIANSTSIFNVTSVGCHK